MEILLSLPSGYQFVILPEGALTALQAVPAEAAADEAPALGAVDATQPFKEEKARLVDAFERRYLAALLERNGGNVSRSAREAGIERAYLQRLVKKFGLRDRD